MPNISSVGTPPPVQQQQPKVKVAEGAEATKGGKDVKNDGDSDNGAVAANANPAQSTAPAAPVTPQPFTNSMGQRIGKTIDVQA